MGGSKAKLIFKARIKIIKLFIQLIKGKVGRWAV